MHSISAAQIRAARALLGISRDALAESTGLSMATIRNLEMGFISHRSLEAVRVALESIGIEFTDDDGVRRKSDDIQIIRGPGSTSILFEDMMQTIKQKGGDIGVVIKSQELLQQSCGQPENADTDQLEKLADLANIKCILTDSFHLSFCLPNMQFKAGLKRHGATPFYVYGNKCALVLPEGREIFKFVVFSSLDICLGYRQQFEALWEAAAPLVVPQAPALRLASNP